MDTPSPQNCASLASYAVSPAPWDFFRVEGVGLGGSGCSDIEVRSASVWSAA